MLRKFSRRARGRRRRGGSALSSPLPRLRGEGRVRGSRQGGGGSRTHGKSPSPGIRAFSAHSDLSPQAGRGEENSGCRLARRLVNAAHGRKIQKTPETEGAPAARARGSRSRR